MPYEYPQEPEKEGTIEDAFQMLKAVARGQT